MRFRSPIRGPWLTPVFGVVLPAALPLVIVTGLLDDVAHGPGPSILGDVGLRVPDHPGGRTPTDPAPKAPPKGG